MKSHYLRKKKKVSLPSQRKSDSLELFPIKIKEKKGEVKWVAKRVSTLWLLDRNCLLEFSFPLIGETGFKSRLDLIFFLSKQSYLLQLASNLPCLKQKW